MAIADKLKTLVTHIQAAYKAVSDLQGTVPAQKNTANLATAINSIPPPLKATGTYKGTNSIGNITIDWTRLGSWCQCTALFQCTTAPATTAKNASFTKSSGTVPPATDQNYNPYWANIGMHRTNASYGDLTSGASYTHSCVTITGGTVWMNWCSSSPPSASTYYKYTWVYLVRDTGQNS